MPEKYGTENLKKVLDVGLEGGNVAGHWSQPGSKGAMELLRLTDEVMLLPSVNFSLLEQEIKDLSETELMELHAHAAKKFDIPQDKVEAIVEKGLAMGLKVVGLVRDGFEMADLVSAAKTA